METPDTPAQEKARKAYDAACRNLAAASTNLRDAQTQHDSAQDAYNVAFGAARQAGIFDK